MTKASFVTIATHAKLVYWETLEKNGVKQISYWSSQSLFSYGFMLLLVARLGMLRLRISSANTNKVGSKMCLCINLFVVVEIRVFGNCLWYYDFFVFGKRVFLFMDLFFLYMLMLDFVLKESKIELVYYFGYACVMLFWFLYFHLFLGSLGGV